MKKIALLFLFLIVVTVVGGSRLLRLNNPDAIHPKSSGGDDLYLSSQVKLTQLSDLLVDSLHLVDNRMELHWAANLLGWQKFQAGHYSIDHGYTYDAFLSKLAKGIQDPISLTIPPGQREHTIIALIVKKMRFDSTAIKKAMNNSSFATVGEFKPQATVAHFFPATYELYWTASPQKALRRIFREFDRQVVGLYKKTTDTTDLNFEQVLTLASIIEGEALHDDEKPEISGLYHNRLREGMKLQADPTVNYALNKRRRLYYKDYEVKSPYNTYLHKGLPPGPINNPSLSSVEAVLHPANNNYLYMVARPDGYHAFSRTYAEHKRKSQKWRKYLQEQARKNADESTSLTN